MFMPVAIEEVKRGNFNSPVMVASIRGKSADHQK